MVNNQDIYKFGTGGYCTERRWTQYYKQLELATNVKFSKYLIIGPRDGIIPVIIQHLCPNSIVDIFDIREGSTFCGNLCNIKDIVKSTYDCVLCCEVLEHIDFIHFDGIIESLKTICSKKLIISIPRYNTKLDPWHKWEIGYNDSCNYEYIENRLKLLGDVVVDVLFNKFIFFNITIKKKNILFFGPCFLRETLIYLPKICNLSGTTNFNMDVLYTSGLNVDFFSDFNETVGILYSKKLKILNEGNDLDLSKALNSHCQFWTYSANNDKWCSDKNFIHRTLKDILKSGKYDEIVFSDNKVLRIHDEDKANKFIEQTQSFIHKIKKLYPKTKFIYFASDCHYKKCKEYVNTYGKISVPNFLYDSINDIRTRYDYIYERIKNEVDIDEYIDGIRFYDELSKLYNRSDRLRHDCTHLYSGLPKMLTSIMMGHTLFQITTDESKYEELVDYVNMSNSSSTNPKIVASIFDIENSKDICTIDYKWKKRE